MNEQQPAGGNGRERGLVPRRAVLAGMALAGLVAGGARPAAAATAPTIHPRSDWASAGPVGPLQQEAAGDVRFLLVHHSETGNDYPAANVARTMQGMYRYHTSDKGWNDIAYNFLVDAYGGIWEGRAGSLAGPVKGDATGGSQGFAQLCCFIGNHTSVPPTQQAQDSMSALLAWLASRYAINLFAGHTITFTSRGSNRWPAGTLVTTDPVAGHRDMSMTECPGEACYPLVRGALLSGAQARSTQPAAAPAPVPTAQPALPTAQPAPATTPAPAAATPAEPTSATSTPATGTPTGASTAPAAPPRSGPEIGTIATVAGASLGGLAVVGVGAGAVIALRNRRSDKEFYDDLHGDSADLHGDSAELRGDSAELHGDSAELRGDSEEQPGASDRLHQDGDGSALSAPGRSAPATPASDAGDGEPTP